MTNRYATQFIEQLQAVLPSGYSASLVPDGKGNTHYSIIEVKPPHTAQPVRICDIHAAEVAIALYGALKAGGK